MNSLLAKYSDKKILITGHTGFKGTWLSRILVLAGAQVFGLSLEPEKDSLFAKIESLGIKESSILDIRDRAAVENYFKSHSFDGIFHLAAQPLVRRSYREPIETFDTNVMGTAHVLNSVVSSNAANWVVVITTDKVYRNVEKLEGYVEDEPLGGKDPYSASKVGTEAAVTAWQQIQRTSGGPKVVAVRAGNVIGGGDWSNDRLIPDITKALNSNKEVVIRNPKAVRHGNT